LETSTQNKSDLKRFHNLIFLHGAMGYGVMVTLHGAMGYGTMVLHGAKNYNKVMASCDHGALACGVMQYNHDALGLGAVQKGQILKFLQIQFILCSSFRKGSVSVTLTVPTTCTTEY
jgi:hypothetical protein